MDPQVARQSDVIGSIKLKFVALNGQPLLAIRTMQLKMRGGKQEFHKLEQFIKSRNPQTGLTRAINYNVGEIDKQMPELFGVSKAILENVVFCHQEDSLWPFKDNATLKTIFDELFETTSFAKTHDNLKIIVKDKRKQLKDQKSIMDMAKYRYDQVIIEMKKYMNMGKDNEATVVKLNEQKAKRMQVHAAIQNESIEEKLRVSSSNCQLLEYQLRQQQDRLANIEATLGFKSESVLTADFCLEERKQNVAEVSKEVADMQVSLIANNQKLDGLLLDAESLRARLNMEDLTEEKTQAKGLIKQINEKLHGHRSPIRAVKASVLLDAAREKIQHLTNEIDVLEKSISEIRSRKAEQVIQTRNQVEGLRNELIKLNSLLDQKTTNSHSDKVSRLENSLKTVENQIKEKDQEILQESEEHTLQTAKLDHAFEQLGEAGKLRQMSEVSKKYQSMKSMQSDIGRVTESIIELCQICEIENHQQLSIFDVERLLKSAIDEEERQREIIAANEKNKIEIEFTITTNDLRKEQLADKINSHQKTLSKSLGKDSLNESHASYENLKESIRELEVNIAIYTKMRQEWLPTMIETSNESGHCQLCTQEFGQTLYHSRKDHFEQFSDKSTDYELSLEKDLEQKKSKFKILKANKDMLLEADRLKEELSGLEKMTESLYLELGRATNTYAKSRRDSSAATKRKDQLRDLQVSLDQKEAFENSLAKLDLSFMDQFSEEDLQKAVKSSVPEESSIVSEMNYRKTLVKQCESQISELERYREALLSNKSEIEKELTSIVSQGRDSRSASSVQEDIDQITATLMRVENDSSVIQASIAEEMEVLESKCTSLRQEKSNLEFLIKEAQLRLDKISAVEGCDEASSKHGRMSEREFEQEQLRNVTNTISEINTLCIDLTKQIELKQKNLDNLSNVVELATVKSSCGHLRQELEKERENILALQKRIEKEKHAKHLLADLNMTISKLEGMEMMQSAQLMAAYDSIYDQRMAEDVYANAIFEYESIRISLQDIEFYSDSVDKSLVVYHQEQVSMINKTIAKLWKATYRNKDIRKIEIKAEQMVEKASSKSNFNYRVVFFGLEDKELDMKGRSSMGQKVLASIVIRIALAQAFGINCGVLTLDEPTTNLDQANIESLAEFLSDLIEQQTEADILQLVIITHDDSFIKLFKRYTDSFYRVSKDDDGWSRLQKVQFEAVPVK